MKFQPMGNNILVKPVNNPEEKKSLIITPDTVRPDQTICEVIAVHPGFHDTNMNFRQSLYKVGDLVKLDAYGGREVDVSGVKHIAVREEEIVGKFILDDPVT